MVTTLQENRIQSDSVEIGGVAMSDALKERFGGEISSLMQEIQNGVKSHQMEKAFGSNQELNDVVSSLRDLNVSNIISADSVERSNVVAPKGSGFELG